jgi:AmmeMemoRadiSam system protein A
MRLTDKDRIELLGIARSSIEEYNNNWSPSSTDSKVLKSHCGAFVTLHKNGRLRGCIGKFNPDYPLYLVIKDVAILSAYHDNRFPQIELEEMTDIDIEISVMTPFKKIRDISDIELGKHGIYIMKGNKSGTFLPQVATETGWNLEEFLGHCTQDKMGMGWNDWKDADIFTYEAEIFNEKQFKNN